MSGEEREDSWIVGEQDDSDLLPASGDAGLFAQSKVSI